MLYDSFLLKYPFIVNIIYGLKVFVGVKWNRCYTMSNYSNKEVDSMARSYNKL